MTLHLAATLQGCAQCLDSTQATPPAVQAAYRHAIYLLGGAAATLFIAATVVLRRQK
jgi:molybdopterin/thiamine biosynthesis adenylyltransferase